MRYLILIFLTFSALAQTRSVVNTGANPNDGTGDTLRTFGTKVNTNFYQLWETVYTNGVAVRGGTNQLTTSWNLLGRTNTVDISLEDLRRFEATATDSTVTGISSLYLDGGTVTLRAATNLQFITPAILGLTAEVGDVFTVTDRTNGTVEFQSLGAALKANVGDPALSVGTIADLIASTGSADYIVATKGYHTAGDGGHGLYRWTNALPAGVLTTNRGTWFAGSSGFWGLIHDGVYNVKQFGAKGDSKANNTTIYVAGNDDTSAIQEAIDTAIIYNGGNIHIPRGTYRITSPLQIQRRDETFTRLGIANPDPDSTYWNDRPNISLTGDAMGSLLVADGTHGVIEVKGKDVYDSYNNRIQNVTIEDINIHHMLTSPNTFCVSVHNAGFITLNQVRSRGGYISLKLRAISESQVQKCDFLSSHYGVWMDYDNGTAGGDMAGVTLLDCNVMSQFRACVVAHYFRDIHIIGGFYGTRHPGFLATIWLSGLSPVACDGFWMQNVGLESDTTQAAPVILIGANGTEGTYNDSIQIYPFNTWTNTQVSMRAPTINDCTMSVASTQGVIRVRGANTSIPKGITINGSRFDTAVTPKLVIIESDVPDSVVVRYGNGNLPVDMITRTSDERPSFLTTTVEANVGNLINGGWRDMSKGGNNWFGSEAPVTVITNLVGPFGVELAGGQQRVTRIDTWAGASPVRFNSNDVVYLDWAVLWPTTNTASISSAVKLFDTTTSTYYDAFNLGAQVEYGTYTNSWGVWKRYIAAMRPTAGVQIDRIAFNNFADTNTTVVLGYLALYADAYSGDMSSLTPSGASVWSGRFRGGDLQWSAETPVAGNWVARKWTDGWAVREAFNSGSTYSKGTSITSGTNVYLATVSGITGGSAPTHTSGIVDDWAFVATGSAATEQRVVSQTAGGVLTTTRVVATVGNFGGGTANASAALDVASTTQGFLPPRMTEAQRDLISSPANGLIIYNSTTDKLQVRAAGSWVDLH
jgi:hypothetical protein